MTHGRRTVNVASHCNKETGLALGIKRKDAKYCEVVPTVKESRRKAQRITPSVTRAENDKDKLTDEPLDRNHSIVNDQPVENDSLPAELKELARIVGSHDAVLSEGKLDVQGIYKKASLELKALIDSKTKAATSRKNCTQSAELFRNEPWDCLIGNSCQERFQAHCAQFRNSSKEQDSVQALDAAEVATIPKPHHHRKDCISVLESSQFCPCNN